MGTRHNHWHTARAGLRCSFFYLFIFFPSFFPVFFLLFPVFLLLPPRAAALGLPPPACGADGPAYGQPPLVLAPCKQILSGLKRESLIKQLCVYNYVLNYLRAFASLLFPVCEKFGNNHRRPRPPAGAFSFSVFSYFWGFLAERSSPAIGIHGPQLGSQTRTALPTQSAS